MPQLNWNEQPHLTLEWNFVCGLLYAITLVGETDVTPLRFGNWNANRVTENYYISFSVSLYIYFLVVFQCFWNLLKRKKGVKENVGIQMLEIFSRKFRALCQSIYFQCSKIDKQFITERALLFQCSNIEKSRSSCAVDVDLINATTADANVWKWSSGLLDRQDFCNDKRSKPKA